MWAWAVINGRAYNKISAPQISHSLATEPLSIGNCNAASLKFTVLMEDEPPEAASVTVMARLMDMEMTEGTETEALPFGTFWVDTCTQSGDYYTLNCYDAMLKTSQAMVDDSDDETAWPKSMAVVVQEIAYRIGVPIDPRTQIRRGLDYLVPYPKGYTMQQVLGWIGACHGGNWTITEDGMLRLVPLTAPPADTCHIVDEDYNDIITAEGHTLAWRVTEGGTTQAPAAGSGVESLTRKTYNIVDHEYNPIVTADGFYLVYNEAGTIEAEQGIIHVPFAVGDITTGKRLKVSRVTMTDESGTKYTAGDDTGFEVTTEGNPYACQAICDDLYEMLHGIEYEPFTAPSAVFDPATELGDQVKIGEQVHSSIYSMAMSLDIGYSNTISAPTNTELTRRFPFLTGEDKRFAKEFLEASTDYGGVSVTPEDGIVVTKTANTAAQAVTLALDEDESAPQAVEGRSGGISRAEVQLSNNFIALRGRDPETGQMQDCIFYDDEQEKYHITRAVLIEQAETLKEDLRALENELKDIEGGEGAEAVSLPQLLRAIQAAQTALDEQRLILDSLDSAADDTALALQAVQTTLADITAQAASIRATVESNAEVLAAADAKLDALRTAQETHGAALTTVQADIAGLGKEAKEHTTALDSLSTGVTSMQATLAAQDAAIAANKETLATVAADMASIKETFAGYTAELTCTEEKISDLQAGQTTQSATLEALQTDMAGLKESAAGQTETMAGLCSKVEDHTATLARLDENLTAVQTVLAAQDMVIAENKAALAEAKTALDGHTETLGQILALLQTLTGGDDPSGGDGTGSEGGGTSEGEGGSDTGETSGGDATDGDTTGGEAAGGGATGEDGEGPTPEAPDPKDEGTNDSGDENTDQEDLETKQEVTENG